MERINTAVRIVVGSVILFTTLSVIFFVLLLHLPSRTKRILLTNRMCRTICHWILRIIGARPVCKHREAFDRSGPAIYVANHGSSLDMFIFGWICRPGTCGIAKRELVWAPLVGPVVWLSGFLLINRSNPAQALASMRKSSTFLQKTGYSAWLMPEGTRSQDGSLGPFKRGFVHMALQSKLPVIPVAIHDAHKVWPMDRLIFRSGEVEVEMLEQIDTTNWNIRTAQKHADGVREVIAQALAARG